MEQHKTGTLYLCATPIGNLEDTPFPIEKYRAKIYLEVRKEDFIYAR